MKRIPCKEFIKKSLIIFYAKNPWLTNKQLSNNVSYMCLSNDEEYDVNIGKFIKKETYASRHKINDDQFISDLKDMLIPQVNPIKSKAKKLINSMIYKYEMMIRKLSDPTVDIFRSNPEERKRYENALEADKKKMKYWHEFEARIEKNRMEWEQKQNKIEPQETSTLVKPNNQFMKH